MGPDTIWILIPLAGISIPIIALWSKHREKVAAMNRGIILDDKGKPVGSAHGDAAMKAEVKELRERIKVLERIVTDGGYNLASEIDALRDTQKVENQDSGVPLGLEKDRV